MMKLRRRLVFLNILVGSRLVWIAGLMLLAVCIIVIPRYVNSLATIRVAVTGPGDDMHLVEGLRDAIGHSAVSLRLKLLTVSSPDAAAGTLERGGSELAVVRSDGVLPKNGETVLVFHRDAALFIAAPKRKIKTAKDLAHKRIAIFPASAQNIALVDNILSQFGVKPADVDRVLLDDGDVEAAIAARRIDAVVSIAPIGSPQTTKLINSVKNGGKGLPVIVEMPQAEGISARHPSLDKVEIPAGYFSAAPALPAEATTVLGVSYLLQARLDMDETLVTDLTKILFSARPQVAATLPLAAAMDKPEDSKTSVRALHLGASAYYADTEKTFMDRYGDWFYIGAMMFSGVISGIAGLVGVGQATARRKAMHLIDQIIEVKEDAQRVAPGDDLSELEARMQALSTTGLQHARDGSFTDAGIAALRLAMDEARRALDDKRAPPPPRDRANVAVLRMGEMPGPAKP